MGAEEMVAAIDSAAHQLEEVESFFGIVVVMDALGAKSLTMQGARDFLQLRDKLVNDLPKEHKEFYSQMQDAWGKQSEIVPAYEVLTFGDSFIFLFPCERHELPEALTWVQGWCGDSILSAMEHKVFLRGALSIGEYLYGGSQSNTVLGPAVADAATWCEQVDWIGLSVTPSAGYFLERQSNRLDSMQYESAHEFLELKTFIKYSAPIKGGGREELWTVMWPGLLVSDELDSMLQKLAEYFAGAPMPKGSEGKYANTWKYAQWLLEESMKWDSH